MKFFSLKECMYTSDFHLFNQVSALYLIQYDITNILEEIRKHKIQQVDYFVQFWALYTFV